MWDTVKATARKYPFSSRKPGSREGDNQSTLTPLYSEILSLKKTASTSLAIPTQKPIFTHSELLQSMNESISRFNLPPDPAGQGKENHPIFWMKHNPRIPTLFYLCEDGKLDDAATGDPVLLQLATELSDSYSEYLSNRRRSEYEVGYLDEVNITQKWNKGFGATQFSQGERPPGPTVLKAKTNPLVRRQPIPSRTTARYSSGSYMAHLSHKRMGSIDPPIRRSQSALTLHEKSQIRGSTGGNELLPTTSGKMTLPRHYNTQASHYGLPTSSLQVSYHQVPPSSPGPVQTTHGNLDQTPHPGHLLTPAPSTEEEEELPMTMAQTLALRRERVISMCGFPNPPLMSNSPPHLNIPPPSTNLPLPPPPTPPPTSTLQASGKPPTFKVPRKPLPPSALRNLSSQTSTPEAIPPSTEDLKNPEQVNTKTETLPIPLPISKSTLSLSSMRSNIPRRSV
ncbi:hypothetical protein HOY80DRAFT_1026164 [Tuber brumale]|nr:hypothetical protein HOY80DRAFT_1026164 [Tuber brumale]